MPSATLASPRLLGYEQPRIFTPPLRPLTRATTRGFEAIDFAEHVLGIHLFPWQQWALIHGLELLEDQTFRFRTLLILVARQNGKTTLMLVIALWRMYVDRSPLVIGTAQNLDVAEEAWQGAVEMAEGVPELAEEIEHVDRTNGKKQLRLETGERYKVAAASRRGGRGLSGDLVMLDELREHRTWEAWSAVSKTTMARARAQILGFSNAGDRGSVVLAELRSRALGAMDATADDDAPGLFDWSAEPGCLLDDRDGWAQANPSLGHQDGITERAIRGALGTDPEPAFRTEVLCQWVDSLTPEVFGPAIWESLSDLTSHIVGQPVFGIDVSPDRSRLSIGVAGARKDGLAHVECVDNDPMHAEGGIIARCSELQATHGGLGFVIDRGSAAGSLIQPLTDAGLSVITMGARDYAQACGAFYDAVTGSTLRHQGDDQPELAAAVAGARQRPLGDAWAWDRKHTGVDLTPLVAVTLALWGLSAHSSIDMSTQVW